MSSPLAQNHFQLFGLEPAFDLDPASLGETYRQLQRAVHPDRYANASDQERRLAVQRAAQVNEAYQTLREPLRRARYLLHLRGIDIREDTNTAMDAAFLMEQMALRERLEEAAAAADPRAALEALGQDLDRRLDAIMTELRRCFADATPVSLNGAAELLRKTRFLRRLSEDVADREERLAG